MTAGFKNRHADTPGETGRVVCSVPARSQPVAVGVEPVVAAGQPRAVRVGIHLRRRQWRPSASFGGQVAKPIIALGFAPLRAAGACRRDQPVQRVVGVADVFARHRVQGRHDPPVVLCRGDVVRHLQRTGVP